MDNEQQNHDLLTRYAIFFAAHEMGVSIEDNHISADEISIVEHQISANPQLSEYLSFLQKNYINIYQDLDASEIGNITLEPVHAKPETRISYRFKSPVMRYAYSAALFFLLAIISLPFISETTTPDYYPMIQESLEIQLPVARSDSESSLETGKDLFNRGRYLDAITTFKSEIQEIQRGHESEIVEYAYYLGLTYLKQAQQSTIGLFPRYHSAYLDSSLKYLELALSKITNRVLLQRDIFWPLGIVEALRYSIKDEQTYYTNAEKYLTFLIERPGKHSARAAELLKKLQEGKNN